MKDDDEKKEMSMEEVKMKIFQELQALAEKHVTDFTVENVGQDIQDILTIALCDAGGEPEASPMKLVPAKGSLAELRGKEGHPIKILQVNGRGIVTLQWGDGSLMVAPGVEFDLWLAQYVSRFRTETDTPPIQRAWWKRLFPGM